MPFLLTETSYHAISLRGKCRFIILFDAQLKNSNSNNVTGDSMKS